MKNSLLLLTAIVAVSCGKPDYTITGELTNATIPPTVYVNVMHKNGAIKPVDSTQIVDNKFTMFGKVTKPEIGFLQFSKEATIPFIIEKGNIYFNINYTSIDDYKVSGTPLNDLFEQFHSNYKVQPNA